MPTRPLRFDCFGMTEPWCTLMARKSSGAACPVGPIGFGTPAFNAVDDGTIFFPTNASASFLVNGTNVVAVEIHQATGTSTDISFDLELIGNTGAISNAPPTVAVIQSCQ